MLLLNQTHVIGFAELGGGVMEHSFLWSNDFITGLPSVDSQHQTLVRIVNEFGALLAENEVKMKHIESLYTDLTAYTEYHFQEEETLMIEHKVDSKHLSTHIQAHRYFITEIQSIYESISVDNLTEAKSFFTFLSKWLAYHILGKDQDMARQIKAILSGMSPSCAYDKEEHAQVPAMKPLVQALNALFDVVSMRNKELKKLNRTLIEMSLTDDLTGLPNRRHAMQFLAKIWNNIKADEPLTCIMIDADNFKAVNDLFGHDVGDLVLSELAQTLKNSFRSTDLVCRLGGDEFLIVCPNTSKQDGISIATSVHTAISNLHVTITNKLVWRGSISIGVATRLPSMVNYTDIIKLADTRVYQAKKCIL